MRFLPHLRKIRLFLSLLFIVGITIFFVDFLRIFDPSLAEIFTFFQFIPSLLKFSSNIAPAAFGFLIIMAVTLLFGRVYCSTFCPLGTFQDIVIRIAKKGRRVKYYYGKNYRILKYTLLGCVAILFAGGSSFGLLLLDPFSNYGRFASGIIKPILLGINNNIVTLLEGFEIYFLFPVELKAFSIFSLIFVFIFFTGLILLAFNKGRLFCNTLCPVGVFLGILSKFSVFKIVIDSNSCRNCGVCEFVCKANCIDSSTGEIDFERCVSCYNCLTVCPDMGVKFSRKSSGLKKVVKFDPEKRKFFASIIAYSVISHRLLSGQTKKKILNLARIPETKLHTVTPPGSVDIEQFTLNCTACHLCVGSCPTQVLQPSFLEYGLLGIQKPFMSFSTSYCNYDCTVCGEVCPTGAILPLPGEEKKLVQIGKAKLIKDNCIVFNQNTACSACSEHCPTKAVHTVPYKNLLAPQVDDTICIGCGACEFACPTKPHKAIFVEGNPYHLTAEKPPLEEAPVESGGLEEFPF
jgi:NAD-dependent dihydropyrimidine dehydrogenase PreA subunit